MSAPDQQRRSARRRFLERSALAAIGLVAGRAGAQPHRRDTPAEPEGRASRQTVAPLRLFLTGDFMPGRGIDQILRHPSEPTIHEPYMRSAQGYVELAEQAHGDIPRGVHCGYVLGDVVSMLEQSAPDVRIVNLETAVTRSDAYWAGKGINYRMHPGNLDCLTRLNIDCCVLANNHVLDWGYEGLEETLDSLAAAGIRTAGAGADRDQAAAPALVEVDKRGRVLVFSIGSATSGIPLVWAATGRQPGVCLLEGRYGVGVEEIAARIRRLRRPRDAVVVSVHWGGNWGYEVPVEQRRLAHALIDDASVDLVHGHSSHHPKGIEVYHGKLILYGCGDFLNDYEGISGYEAYRDDLSIAYFPELDAADGRLKRLSMRPLQMRRFQLRHAAARDRVWLAQVLDRECARFGCGIDVRDDALELRWS